MGISDEIAILLRPNKEGRILANTEIHGSVSLIKAEFLNNLRLSYRYT
jgi:hypothetical protein